MDELVTCVITTYKREKSFLKRAIESVLNQTYSNIELLVMNDNHKDRYKNIVSELIDEFDKSNITHVYSGKNIGVQKQRNKAIELANGKYISFLDDDDFWLSNKISSQVNLFNQNPKLGLVYGDYVILDIEDKQISKRIIDVPVYDSKEESLKELFRKNYIASTSIPLIKKDVFKKVGKFDESLIASQDYDMWVRIVREYEIVAVPFPIMVYYIHDGERISSNAQRKIKAEKIFLNKYFEYYSKDLIALSNKYMMIGLYLLKSDQFANAREYFKKSISLNYRNIRLYKYYFETYLRR